MPKGILQDGEDVKPSKQVGSAAALQEITQIQQENQPFEFSKFFKQRPTSPPMKVDAVVPLCDEPYEEQVKILNELAAFFGIAPVGSKEQSGE